MKTRYLLANSLFMQPYANVSDKEFPIVLVEFTGSNSTDENFAAYLMKLRDLYDRKQIFTIIFDASKANVPSYRHQKMQAEWLKINDQLIQTYCKGTAYIIPNPIIRAVLKAIFVLQKQSVPYAIFQNIAQGKSWVSHRLAQDNSKV